MIIAMPTPSRIIYHALLRCHHIRSRSKIKKLQSAAKSLDISYLLLKSDGATPGVMYVRGFDEEGVESWVETVKGLRYLNFEVKADVQGLEVVETEGKGKAEEGNGEEKKTVVEEVGTLKDFAGRMEEMDLRDWFRVAMGFVKEEG